MSELIAQALSEATDTKAVVLGEGVIARVGQVFKELFGASQAVVVADERTFELAGRRVCEALAEAGVALATPHVFPGEPELYARYENCEALRDVLAGVDAVAVAVGAGTLNDIVKRASGELDRPYLVVGTAASMDGYTAFGASIALDGFKQTLSCPAPCGCVADVTVMAAAPQVMTASGYGDLLGKVPAGADWIIADALGTEAIDGGVWELVQGPLRGALARPADLAAGDVTATTGLAEGLLMSGLAMQAHQSSRPASGAEHQFSHLWEMEGHGVDVTPRRLSHGFKVGIGSVAIAALYERLLERDLTRLDIDQAVAAWPTREAMEAEVRRLHPDPKLVEETVVQALAKWLTPDELRSRLTLLTRVWPELARKLRDQLLPAAELQRMLRAVGAPAHPSDIGLGWRRFRDTYVRAQMIRKRYTVLDLALEANLLPELVDELFTPTGFWGSQEPTESSKELS
ncbi:MAG: sn-glycerol-1-phosphate dehydrogenase [Propionibacteriaceae bacterium]|nr:sn-glycerol-1-phosphate dehydrogenase [Propionibacteriaceae bacterium]